MFRLATVRRSLALVAASWWCRPWWWRAHTGTRRPPLRWFVPPSTTRGTPNAWNQSGVDPFTKYQPSAGYYSSSDPDGDQPDRSPPCSTAISTRGSLVVGTGFPGGQGGADRPGRGRRHRIQVVAVLRARGLRGSEREPDPERPELHQGRYAGNPELPEHRRQAGHLRLRRPVRRLRMAQRWSQANATEGFYTVLKVFSGYTACARTPARGTSTHPSSAEDHQGGYAFSVSPGFYKSGESAPRLARNLSTWARERARHGGQQRAAAVGDDVQRVG